MRSSLRRIKEAVKSCSEGSEARLVSLRKAFGGARIAVVVLSVTDAKKICATGRLRVGLVFTHVRHIEHPNWSYRCLAFGHVMRGCTKVEQSNNKRVPKYNVKSTSIIRLEGIVNILTPTRNAIFWEGREETHLGTTRYLPTETGICYYFLWLLLLLLCSDQFLDDRGWVVIIVDNIYLMFLY